MALLAAVGLHEAEMLVGAALRNQEPCDHAHLLVRGGEDGDGFDGVEAVVDGVAQFEGILHTLEQLFVLLVSDYGVPFVQDFMVQMDYGILKGTENFFPLPV